MTSLDDLRKQIDETDQALVELLERRAELALKVRQVKKEEALDVYSPAREKEILDKVSHLASEGAFPEAALRTVFRAIVSGTRSLVGELRVGYLGSEGSLDHAAALKQFGSEISSYSATTEREIFEKVSSGDLGYGVVAFELSSGGLSSSALKLLRDFDVRIIAEVLLSSTRYVVLGKEPVQATEDDKTSLLCTIADGSGALRELLKPFSDEKLTLTKIESRQIKDSPEEYLFYMEVLGHESEEKLRKAIEALRPLCAMTKILGSFPVGRS